VARGQVEDAGRTAPVGQGQQEVHEAIVAHHVPDKGMEDDHGADAQVCLPLGIVADLQGLASGEAGVSPGQKTEEEPAAPCFLPDPGAQVGKGLVDERDELGARRGVALLQAEAKRPRLGAVALDRVPKDPFPDRGQGALGPGRPPAKARVLGDP